MDFTGLKLKDEAKAALELLTADKAFTEYVKNAEDAIESTIKETLEAETSPKIKEFRENNLNLANELKKAKEDLDRLNELGGDASKAEQKFKELEVQHEATVNSLNEKITAFETETKELTQAKNDDRFKFDMLDAVRRHNHDNPTMKMVESGNAIDHLVSDAKKSYKIINEKYVMLDSNGKELKNDSGFASQSEWVGNVYLKENPHLIHKEAGSDPDGTTSTNTSEKADTSNGKILAGLTKLAM